jgi:hypothetical protein
VIVAAFQRQALLGVHADLAGVPRTGAHSLGVTAIEVDWQDRGPRGSGPSVV